MEYDLKVINIQKKIDKIIKNELGEYNIDNLQDIIVELICSNEFTSKESVQSLIDILEKTKKRFWYNK